MWSASRLQWRMPPMTLLHTRSHYEVTFLDRAEYLTVETSRRAANQSAMKAVEYR